MKQILWLVSAMTLVSCSAVDKPTDDCPESCPVIAICQICDDGSCADPVVSCNPDGSCGDVDWVCADEPDPDPNQCDEPCAVPDICHLCDDGSCATPDVQCNEDGTCGEIEWRCE